MKRRMEELAIALGRLDTPLDVGIIAEMITDRVESFRVGHKIAPQRMALLLQLVQAAYAQLPHEQGGGQ